MAISTSPGIGTSPTIPDIGPVSGIGTSPTYPHDIPKCPPWWPRPPLPPLDLAAYRQIQTLPPEALAPLDALQLLTVYVISYEVHDRELARRVRMFASDTLRVQIDRLTEQADLQP
jgi:hypothetical protein